MLHWTDPGRSVSLSEAGKAEQRLLAGNLITALDTLNLAQHDSFVQGR